MSIGPRYQFSVSLISDNLYQPLTKPHCLTAPKNTPTPGCVLDTYLTYDNVNTLNDMHSFPIRNFTVMKVCITS